MSLSSESRKPADSLCSATTGSGPVLRTVRLEDSVALAELIRQNQQFLHGWMPAGDQLPAPDFVERILDQYAAGSDWYGVIEYHDELAGALSINNIRFGVSRCATLGYWVSQHVNGRGIATEAVRLAAGIAFESYGLHRIDAFTREDNTASQRVLEKNGFHRAGLSRGHHHIGGRWWDMIFFQKIAPWDDGQQLTPPGHG